MVKLKTCPCGETGINVSACAQCNVREALKPASGAHRGRLICHCSTRIFGAAFGILLDLLRSIAGSVAHVFVGEQLQGIVTCWW
jgi:hypothetical protein